MFEDHCTTLITELYNDAVSTTAVINQLLRWKDDYEPDQTRIKQTELY
jgi:hypothetical protein